MMQVYVCGQIAPSPGTGFVRILPDGLDRTSASIRIRRGRTLPFGADPAR